MTVIVNRRLHTDGLSTLGQLSIDGTVACYILEPGFETPVHPCVPAGDYPLELRAEGGKFAKFHAVFGEFVAPGLPHILVPGREWVLVHPGNTIADTEACSLPGSDCIEPSHTASGHWEVVMSRDAFRRIYPRLVVAVRGGNARWKIVPVGESS